MPLPAEDTLPPNAPAGPSTSHTHPVGSAAPAGETSTQELLDKFKKLGEEAKAEEADEGDDDEDDEGEVEAGVGGSGAGPDTPGASGETGGGKKKKKKKKGKAGKAVQRLKDLASGQAPQELVDTIRSNMDPSEQTATDEKIKKALKAVDLMKILDGQVALGNKSNTKIIGEHKFWKTQPVPQTGSGPSSAPAVASDEGPIDAPKKPSEVRQEPLALPSGFEWSLIEIKDDVQCEEVYTLLSENYVEDDDAMFRFRYSKEFLLWALTAPGYHPDWHIGVRVQKTGKLVAFISGILVDLRVRSRTFPSAEINFLCVHKKLRAKRLTPVLIKEVTRRVNLRNVWQAIYTAGIVLPTPIGTSRYYHRNLNPPKLVDVGFSPLPRSMTIARLIKQLAIPTSPKLAGFREMEKRDVAQVAALLRRYMARFEVAQAFESDDEVEHWFLSGRGREGGEGGAIAGGVESADAGEEGKWRRAGQVVWAYVVEDPSSGRITDMISFYSLPSSIMKHATHKVLNAAYLYYYATDVLLGPADVPASSASSSSSATIGAAGGAEVILDRKNKERLGARLVDLSGDLMIVAKNAGFDVLNALTLLDNNMFLSEQKFGAGDGFLNADLLLLLTPLALYPISDIQNYYLYNWQCAPVDGGIKGTVGKQSAGIGMVML